ncbi:Actin-binding FH2/DRF autoregulatory [Corchorus olitorius]|uniref:Formin-like protein n=1 Tax=Corchorus olitorius TaxID=93759 RepID=A0A1R3K8D5_9ROSI|nr:Actin-binding FH2/DRF autoregulatory [Corchorus olitorius]
MEIISNNGKQIEKVSGQEENEEKEALILQKFRALLGLKSGKKRKTSFPECFSPSPSPYNIEAETSLPPAPAPAPASLKPPHFHSPPPRSSAMPLPHKTPKGNSDKGGKVRRILVPVLVSAGAAFLACLLGVICFCGKIKKHRKKYSTTSFLTYKKKGRSKGKSKSKSNKYASSTNSSSKVSLNPSLDLFYLNSLGGVDLEQQNGETEKTSNKEEVGMQESDNASSSSTREIMSVHEEVESDRYDSDGVDKIIPIESHSSDDESFHSFANSHSSNIRLSNASAGSSLSDPLEVQPSMSPEISAHTRALQPQSPRCRGNPPDCSKNSTPPPPPPPPPPLLPPVARISPLNPSLSATKARFKASSSSTFPNGTPSKSLPSPPPCIPPPPCPPPFLKGSLPPPPPPGQLPDYTALGKDGSPLPKLKPLHWDKVRAAPDRSMVWDKLRSSSFELDEEMIESLFGYNIHNSMKNDETKSKTPSPSKHVLEPKRLQNITILLKALNVTPEQACNALIKGNGLSLQQLEALVKMVPTKEEEDKLFSYKGDINELGAAEKFVKLLLTIPFAFFRAEAMLYRETFEDEVIHLKNSFSMLEEACKELRSSRLFLKLLEAVLKTGNRMNVGTIRGGARAFKLDALLKLADVKGTDGKTTLLHFVVQEIIRSEGIRVSDSIMGKINQGNKIRSNEEKEEDYRRMGLDLVSGLGTELYHVKKTATIDLDVLASSVSNLSDGKAKLQHLVEVELSNDEKSGNFIRSMNSFLIYADKNLKELQEDEHRVLLHVKEITEYFHGDVTKLDEANPLRIFVIVRDFLGMLDHVCKELRNLKVPSSPSPLAPFR